MRDWLESNLSCMDLSEDAEGYLLGRAMSSRWIRELGIVEWSPQMVQGAPMDPEFTKRVGYQGRYIHNFLCIPLRSPLGVLVGVEFRSWAGEKSVRQYRLYESNYSPVFVGLTPSVVQRVWEGADVWVVEGVFDMAALYQVVPDGDVVLGTLRARVSNAHAEFLSRFGRGRVHMVYDQDETGRNMTYGYIHPQTGQRVWGALDSLKRVGVDCRDVPYRGGKDPGEIWDAGGVPALRTAFAGEFPHGQRERQF